MTNSKIPDIGDGFAELECANCNSIQERLDLQITANDDLMVDYKEAVKKIKQLEESLEEYCVNCICDDKVEVT